MIILTRDSGCVDLLRSYTVLLDGKAVGSVRNGGRIELDAVPGHHTLRMKIDWCGSESVEFEYLGEPLHFECGSNLRGWRVFRGIVYVFLKTKSWIWLRQSGT